MRPEWPRYDWSEVHLEQKKSIKRLIFESVKLHNR